MSGTDAICGEGTVEVGGGDVVTGGGVEVGGVTTGGGRKLNMACNFWTIAVSQARSFGGVVADEALDATNVGAARRVAVGAATTVVPVAAAVVSVAVDGTVFVDRVPGDTAFARRAGLTAVVPAVESCDVGDDVDDDDGRGTAGDGFAEEPFVDERDVLGRDTTGFFVPDLDVFEIGVTTVEGTADIGDLEIAKVDLFDAEFTDEMDVIGPADDAGPDPEASEESAQATPQPANMAAPIPIATAKPPTRPTYAPAPIVPHPLDAFNQLIVSRR